MKMRTSLSLFSVLFKFTIRLLRDLILLINAYTLQLSIALQVLRYYVISTEPSFGHPTLKE